MFVRIQRLLQGRGELALSLGKIPDTRGDTAERSER